MNTVTIEKSLIFTVLNALYDRKSHVMALLESFNKNDTLLNNVYNKELDEINTLIDQLTR